MRNTNIATTQQEWSIEPRGAGILTRVVEVLQSRKLLWYFAVQAVAKTYRRTHLGVAWLFIRPLFPLLIGLFVFQGLVGDKVTDTPYLIFYVSGLCIWQLFAQGISWTTRSLESNRKLLKKLYFPRLILPIAFIAPASVEFFIQLWVLLGVAVYYQVVSGVWYLQITWGSSMCLLASLALALGLAMGIGLWTSILAAEARDVRYFMGYILGFWQYLTPVFYPLEAIPASYRSILRFNPMGPACELFRKGVLGVGVVSQEDLVVAAVTVALIFGSGLLFFARYEKILADHV